MIKRNQQEMQVLQENNLRSSMDDVDYRLFIERIERKQTCGFKTSALQTFTNRGTTTQVRTTC